MKRIFIIHRWDGKPEGDWYPWLKNELEKKGFFVEVPSMPDTSEPKMEKWVSFLKKTVGKVDENTFFVGHSIGCQTILRYIESLKNNEKVGGCVFVAGWFNLDNLEDEEVRKVVKPWIETLLDFDKIKKKVKKIIVFISNNEPYGFVKENAKIFIEKLGAKVIIEKERGHFTEDDGIKKVDAVLKEVVKIAE